MPEKICQTCMHRKKFNRRSACALRNDEFGSYKTIGCLDRACEKYEWRGFYEKWEKGGTARVLADRQYMDGKKGGA